MTHLEIRQKFLDYFSAHDHAVVSSSSLVPTNDESVLLTTAGMQQFKPYLMGEADALADFGNTRLASVQKCFRTSDIDEVGDEDHHTFFEMLGNFSIGDPEKSDGIGAGYFKEKAIPLAWNFLVGELELDPQRLFVSVFAGAKGIPKDREAKKIWEQKAPGIEVREYGMEENFWGPPGETGPCGPCSEIHYILPSGREVEVWNLVFMEYFKGKDGSYTKLKQQNIDTGMGFERLVLILQGKEEVFETDLFAPIVEEVKRVAEVGGKVGGNDDIRSLRVVADHLRGAVFLIGDGVQPLNVGRGYILRRILRRAVLHGRLLDIGGYFLREPAEKVIELYGGLYPELRENEKEILTVIHEEEEKFGKTLSRGLKELEKMGQNVDAFVLYDTYGFPLEMTKELAQSKGFKVDEKDFGKKLKEQQERARAALKDRKVADELIAPQHTAAHLLNAALKEVLGPQVRQAGQYLEEGRFRHDFTFGRKLTEEEVKKVEELVNKKISENIPILRKETSLKEAKEEGAEAVFTKKYQDLDKVTVYQVGGSPESAFSKELCGGPHVKSTSELGKFAIIKEGAAGAGVRRIYAKAGGRRVSKLVT